MSDLEALLKEFAGRPPLATPTRSVEFRVDVVDAHGDEITFILMDARFSMKRSAVMSLTNLTPASTSNLARRVPCQIVIDDDAVLWQTTRYRAGDILKVVPFARARPSPAVERPNMLDRRSAMWLYERGLYADPDGGAEQVSAEQMSRSTE